MPTLRGTYVQALTGRELTYWCSYEVVDKTALVYVAIISEGRNHLGQYEATLRYDPFGIPARAVVRMDLLKYLDRTPIGQGTEPDARWIGWYGPFL